MSRIAAFLVAFLLTALPPEASAQDYQVTGTTNALNDMARAQRDQADSMRRQESIMRDQARAESNARHNAEVTSRSMRRFDR